MRVSDIRVCDGLDVARDDQPVHGNLSPPRADVHGAEDEPPAAPGAPSGADDGPGAPGGPPTPLPGRQPGVPP